MRPLGASGAAIHARARLPESLGTHSFGRSLVAKKPHQGWRIIGVIWRGDRGMNAAPTAVSSGGWGVTIGTAAFPEGKAVPIIAPQLRLEHQTYAIGKWGCADNGAATQQAARDEPSGLCANQA